MARFSLSRRAFLRALGVAAGSGTLHARGAGPVQTPQLFRSDVELVTTAVTVTDEAGRLVTTLGREDFEIYEDGRVQRVAQFTSARVPVSLGLALDTSDSMAGQRLTDAQAAIRRFLDDLLAPGDEAAVILFNHRPHLATAWTAARGTLHRHLDGLHPQGGTAIYDAIVAALPLFAERGSPRAALVVISDGADTASDTTLVHLRSRLLREDVFVYAIAIDAPDARPSARVNPHALRELTGQSGGYTEIITDSAELGPATARIAEELNHQYMVGYTPDRAPDGEFRTIRVRVRSGDYRVRARRGYVAVPRRP
jgi:Ca-activated chloride channel homolog